MYMLLIYLSIHIQYMSILAQFSITPIQLQNVHFTILHFYNTFRFVLYIVQLNIAVV